MILRLSQKSTQAISPGYRGQGREPGMDVSILFQGFRQTATPLVHPAMLDDSVHGVLVVPEFPMNHIM